MRSGISKIFITAGVLILFKSTCIAEGGGIKDPMIPGGEKIVYNMTIGTNSVTVTEETALKIENGREIYEFSSKSELEDRIVKIDRKTMLPYYSHTIQKSQESVIDRKASLVKDKTKTGENEITLMDFYGLMYVLRGFPFKSNKTFKLKIMGANNPFSMCVRLHREVKLKVSDRTIDCYQVELFVSGIMGKIFPKSYLWYSTEAPHYLVRSEGSSMGSPKQVMELIGYSFLKK